MADLASLSSFATNIIIPELSLAGPGIGMRVGLRPGTRVSVGKGVMGIGVIVTGRPIGVAVRVATGDGTGLVAAGGGYAESPSEVVDFATRGSAKSVPPTTGYPGMRVGLTGFVAKEELSLNMLTTTIRSKVTLPNRTAVSLVKLQKPPFRFICLSLSMTCIAKFRYSLSLFQNK
jgi:hypothetical protein